MVNVEAVFAKGDQDFKGNSNGSKIATANVDTVLFLLRPMSVCCIIEDRLLFKASSQRLLLLS